MNHQKKHWPLIILVACLCWRAAGASEGSTLSDEYCVRRVGDFNGDGIEDYAISKKQPHDYPLRAYIWMGGELDPAAIDPADLSRNPFVLSLKAPFADMFQCSVRPLAPIVKGAPRAPLRADGSPVGRPTYYRLLQIDTIDPYPWGYPLVDHINSKGQCVGQYQNHAFFYDGEIHDLGTLGGSSSEAFGINDGGHVVGQSGIQEGEDRPAAFVYDGSEMHNLGLGYSWANKINARDQIVGGMEVADGLNPIFHAFLYEGGFFTDLGTLGGTHSNAHALNAAGQVVGEAETILPGTNYPTTHAFIYANGLLRDLGVLGSNCFNPPADCSEQSVATDINTSGQIVGYSSTDTSSARAFLKKGPVMKDLGTAGGGSSWAYGINDAGQIVGTSLNSGETAYVPFLFDDGTMYNLYDLILDFPAVQFPPFLAKDIDNFGRIVGPYLILDPEYEQIVPDGEYAFDTVLGSQLIAEYWIAAPQDLIQEKSWVQLQVNVAVPGQAEMAGSIFLNRWWAAGPWIASDRWGLGWHRAGLRVPTRLQGTTATVRMRVLKSGIAQTPAAYLRHFKMEP